MKVITRLESMEVEPQSQPEHFSGEAGFHVLHTMTVAPAGPPDPVTAGGVPPAGTGTWNTHPGNVSMVRFEPGSRTHWHSHSGGQLLLVVEGEGWVQTRGEAPQSVGPGDTVSIEPDEVHWHGAKRGQAMAHVAVTVGRPTWLDEAPSPD